MSILNRLKIKAKLALLLGLSAVSLAVAILMAASLLHQRMMDDRIAKLRSIVEVVQGMAQSLEDDVVAGKMTRDQASARFRTNIHRMWYDDHHDYVVVFTMDGVAIANANAPNQEGTSRLGTKDINGKPIVGSFIEALKSADEAVVGYMYPKPGTTGPLPKLTFVKRFRPWNALIGTGVYTDDIEAGYRSVLWHLGGTGMAILVVLAAIAWLVNHNISGSLANLKARMEKLAAGDLSVTITETGRADEIGAIARTVEVF